MAGPKSMAAAILERCPTASTDLVDFWVLSRSPRPVRLKPDRRKTDR
jgi:hypothetical protein